ncbi:gamma-glutamyl-gamma-aminobutyrate hydrolase family protein [Candidatus Saccharibacteria bacterium]|nr:MAG: gamma-glutamyl-gamma-aminobutyrate hydrolase family protein [Candidatus Saccharibacteria bacterium]
MHTRPTVIGVTPAFDEGVKLPASQASLYIRREYTQVLNEAGVLPVILSPDMPVEYILELCDGLVISGGEDIPGEVYGGEKLLTVPEPLERVMWERVLIDRFTAANKPILGVCYGMQLLALHYGGSLYQDIHAEVELSIEHVGVTHDVSMKTDFLGLKKAQTYQVVSRHHQAVATLPDGFELCAVAPDGVIEAMQSERSFGIQWHAESDRNGSILYREFIARCG